jgi:hypothetical protein
LEELMKKILLFSLLCLPVSFFFNPFTFAQPLSGPRMILEEKHHDFNEVNEGEEVEHSFKVKNLGDQVLEIQRVKPG